MEARNKCGHDESEFMAASIRLRLQDNQHLGVRRDPDNPELTADDVEPAGPAANEGELPTLTDEGEHVYPPSREAEFANKK